MTRTALLLAATLALSACGPRYLAYLPDRPQTGPPSSPPGYYPSPIGEVVIVRPGSPSLREDAPLTLTPSYGGRSGYYDPYALDFHDDARLSHQLFDRGFYRYR